MPYLFYINLNSVLHGFNPDEETNMSNKRNKGDDAPQTPLPRQSGRHNPNTPVSYSEAQRTPLRSAVAIATTPLIHNASLALTSMPVKDQRQIKTIAESHVSSAVAYADVGGPKSPKSDSEIETGLFDPNKTCMTSLNMGFATLFLHVMNKKVADTTTGNNGNNELHLC
jgi:hypothetical protein